MKPVLLGQAPARSGDGRPFTGRSGERLQGLLGLSSYDQLEEVFHLDNVIHHKQDRLDQKGDEFPLELARKNAQIRVMTYQISRYHDIICCGKQVWKAMGFKQAPWFSGVTKSSLRFWLFPHPSGVSTFWNAPRNRTDAADFLKHRLRASGIDLGAIRSQAIPIAQDAPQSSSSDAVDAPLDAIDELCGATDPPSWDSWSVDEQRAFFENQWSNSEPYGRCTKQRHPDSKWHQELREGKVWAEWSGPAFCGFTDWHPRHEACPGVSAC